MEFCQGSLPDPPGNKLSVALLSFVVNIFCRVRFDGTDFWPGSTV
jgi:hypothetical protein